MNLFSYTQLYDTAMQYQRNISSQINSEVNTSELIEEKVSWKVVENYKFSKNGDFFKNEACSFMLSLLLLLFVAGHCHGMLLFMSGERLFNFLLVFAFILFLPNLSFACNSRSYFKFTLWITKYSVVRYSASFTTMHIVPRKYFF